MTLRKLADRLPAFFYLRQIDAVIILDGYSEVNCETLGDTVRLTEAHIMRTRNPGKISADEIAWLTPCGGAGH